MCIYIIIYIYISRGDHEEVSGRLLDQKADGEDAVPEMPRFGEKEGARGR